MSTNPSPAATPSARFLAFSEAVGRLAVLEDRLSAEGEVDQDAFLDAAELATLEGKLAEVLAEVRRRMSEERLGEFPPCRCSICVLSTAEPSVVTTSWTPGDGWLVSRFLAAGMEPGAER